MPEKNSYNPNAVWTSKKKKFVYEPKSSVSQSSAPLPPKIPVPVLRPEVEGESGGGVGKKIAIAVIIVVVLVALGVGAYFVFKPAPPIVVSVAFVKPAQVLVGDAFPFSVSYANNSATAIRDATLSLTLPDGVSFAGQTSNQRVMQWSVGTVDAGITGSQEVSLIVTGNPDSVLHVAAVLTYNPNSSASAQLQTSASTGIVVGSPVIGLTITAPAAVSSGQNFTLAIAYVNNATHALDDAKIQLQYPPGFSFAGSTVSPDSLGSDEWDLGSLAAGANGSFAVTGSMVGQDNASYAVPGTVTIAASGENYAIASQTANFAIAPSPLKLTVTLDNQQNYVAEPGDSLSYSISYVNDSTVALQNAVITASFVGSMFNFPTLSSAGSFNSITDTVTWSGANTPALQKISPGQSGTVSVGIKTDGSFPIRLLSDKNYVLKIHAQIFSPTVPAGTAASSTVSAADLTSKVGGLVKFSAAGYFIDPDSAMASNTGKYPPQVNQPTQYTIHWDITNYSTDIANVAVSAYLQSGTTCTGELESNVPGSLPSCDPTTGLVNWAIPAIPATTGVVSPPAEAIFQVVNTPAVNQVGQSVILLGQTKFTATDAFASSTVNLSADVIDTSLPHDKSKNAGNGRVGE